MVQASWIAPVAQVGRELRIELRATYRESRIAAFVQRVRPAAVPVLPDQRLEDEHTFAQRKADNQLQSVRLGAVRR